jgi:hypothetical protein
VTQIAELPGKGLTGTVMGKQVQITSRKHFVETYPASVEELPPITGGLECIVLIDEHYAATCNSGMKCELTAHHLSITCNLTTCLTG